LFKKVVLADSFAYWADLGFDGNQSLDFYAAWGTSLAYTFQLYFDFSGYCDMAVGASLLFNIWLPINFNSPYKALNIQDFWRRWHITLSSFLRDYLYIPLGGSRGAAWRTSLNLFLTFLLGGLWHGATWMFVIWGALHGTALVVHRMWRNAGGRMPAWLGWLITFAFVNFAWVFFRARTLWDAKRVFLGMLDFRSIASHATEPLSTGSMAWAGWFFDPLARVLPAGLAGQLPTLAAIALGFVLIGQRNSMELAGTRVDTRKAAVAALLFVIAMHFVLSATSSVFLYFNF
jgi:D-alanyl-lipoteichoic acid acyltransferase DltB (MBOAT superfamily)